MEDDFKKPAVSPDDSASGGESYDLEIVGTADISMRPKPEFRAPLAAHQSSRQSTRAGEWASESTTEALNDFVDTVDSPSPLTDDDSVIDPTLRSHQMSSPAELPSHAQELTLPSNLVITVPLPANSSSDFIEPQVSLPTDARTELPATGLDAVNAQKTPSQAAPDPEHAAEPISASSAHETVSEHVAVRPEAQTSEKLSAPSIVILGPQFTHLGKTSVADAPARSSPSPDRAFLCPSKKVNLPVPSIRKKRASKVIQPS